MLPFGMWTKITGLTMCFFGRQCSLSLLGTIMYLGMLSAHSALSSHPSLHSQQGHCVGFYWQERPECVSFCRQKTENSRTHLTNDSFHYRNHKLSTTTIINLTQILGYFLSIKIFASALFSSHQLPSPGALLVEKCKNSVWPGILLSRGRKESVSLTEITLLLN